LEGHILAIRGLGNQTLIHPSDAVGIEEKPKCREFPIKGTHPFSKFGYERSRARISPIASSTYDRTEMMEPTGLDGIQNGFLEDSLSTCGVATLDLRV